MKVQIQHIHNYLRRAEKSEDGHNRIDNSKSLGEPWAAFIDFRAQRKLAGGY
jgi:hypothetical protein